MTGTVAHCPISSLHLIMRVETSLVMWLHIPCYHPECATDKLVYTSLPTVPLHIFLRLSFFTVKRQHFLLVQHLGCSDSTPHIFFNRLWKELWGCLWLSNVWLCRGRRSCACGSWRRWRHCPVAGEMCDLSGSASMITFHSLSSSPVTFYLMHKAK